MIRFFLVAAFFVLFAGHAFAQEEFYIRVFGGTDIAPPTTPTLLNATPIGPTQIDISWSSSTDNFTVSGYSIFRGSSTIATTTLTSYSDTGLSASTTYSYSVRAFDLSYNYSTTSNSISTTTPDYPPPAATTTPTATTEVSTEGTSARVVLDSIDILTDNNSAKFVIDTARPARIELRWGRTASYEIGYLVKETISKKNSVLITDLEPGTTYEYKLIGYTPFGIKTELKSGTFTTEETVPVQSLENVRRFSASSDGLDVKLAWVNPSSDDFAYVRVVRSHLGFPRHPQDGAIVYQGAKDGFVDKSIFAQYSPVYYTAFVYDKDGNVSSGAVAVAYPEQSVAVETGRSIDFVPEYIGGAELYEEPTGEIFTERFSSGMKMPELNEIVIIQEDSEFSLLDRDISLDKDTDFIVSIDSDYITGNLKSIIFTVVNPSDTRERYSYLLRINKNQNAYIATIPAVNVIGNSWGILDVYDYQAEIVSSYQAPIYFTEKVQKVVFPDIIFENPSLFGMSLMLLISLILVIIFAVWLRTEDKT